MRDSPPPPTVPPATSKPGVAKKWLVAILVVAFAFVLMPFLLWYMTTFSRPLTDAGITSYFSDKEHPRRAQHALSQVADRILSPNPATRDSAKTWYSEVLKLSSQGSDELRVTAAWVMGQDNQSQEFHAALLNQLADPNPMVARNAALSLVRFGDAAGHDTIASILDPFAMAAPRTGTLLVRLKQGDAITAGTMVAQILANGEKTEVRSQVPGTIERWIAADGSGVQAGQPILLVRPSSDMAWESLRALYLIGRVDDLPKVENYAHGTDGMPPQIQQQAELTAQAISSRASK
jgi:biotin carboxyl carrier protein